MIKKYILDTESDDIDGLLKQKRSQKEEQEKSRYVPMPIPVMMSMFSPCSAAPAIGILQGQNSQLEGDTKPDQNVYGVFIPFSAPGMTPMAQGISNVATKLPNVFNGDFQNVNLGFETAQANSTY